MTLKLRVANLYRLREPVIQEAHQWLPDDAGTPSAIRVADWLDERQAEWSTRGIGKDCTIVLKTANGASDAVGHGDWIVLGTSGFFVRTDADFSATYEHADDQ